MIDNRAIRKKYITATLAAIIFSFMFLAALVVSVSGHNVVEGFVFMILSAAGLQVCACQFIRLSLQQDIVALINTLVTTKNKVSGDRAL